MAKMSLRRKLAISSWSAPKEGNIYGKLTVDATELLKYIQHIRDKTGNKVTITHLVGKVVAEALKEAPGLNGRIFLGRFIPHETIDVTYLVALEDGNNLAKAKIENADQKSMLDIADDLRALAERLRKGKDDNFNKTQDPLKWLPTFLIKPLVWTVGYLSSAMGLSIKALGVEKFPFGSAIITSVGMFGLDEGFAPPTPFARVPLYVLVGAVKRRPAFVDDELINQPQLTITATIDHRFVDGFQAGKLANRARALLENPWLLDEDESPSLPAASEKGE
ncbi:MAG: hypothetical protein CL920_27795 [Deltaproteobacteria bacterium]|nr:hypothetical protein [Deltaproteobacteria bacterium]|tara:strand:+ start:3105 stop:3938 length:834 start_codon:yes stop_codon:yes gene_type:complete